MKKDVRNFILKELAKAEAKKFIIDCRIKIFEEKLRKYQNALARR